MMEKIHNIINLADKYHYLDKTSNRNRILQADGVLREYIKKKKITFGVYDSAMMIATEIAEKSFDCDTIIAAIFYDIPISAIEVAYKDEISSVYRVISILKSYNKLKIELEHIYNDNVDRGDAHIDAIKEIDPQAFAIKLAEQKSAICDQNKNGGEIQKIAQFTRNVIVPLVQQLGAYRDADELSELCLKVENNLAYHAISNKIRERKNQGRNSLKNTLMKLKNIFDPNNKLIPEGLLKYQQYIREFRYEDRTIISIYRYVNERITNWDNGFDDFMACNNVAMYDCFLIIKDINKEISPIDLFFAYYNYKLRYEKIYILNYGKTTYRDSSYFMLCDEMDNKYRFFIKSETEDLHYLYGEFVEKEKAYYLPENRERRINVFKKDGSVESIVAGATVLDLAFKIHSDLGLYFDYALLNNNPEYMPPYTVLNKGDTVEIKKKNSITADLKWFRYVKTNRAINELYRYFKTEFERLKKENKIEIITKDGTIQKLDYGATVLDLAFSIHQDLGLHFSYALINNKKTHMEPYTQLKQGDEVVVYSDKRILPDLSWFRYVKTEVGVKGLVKYFQKKEEDYKLGTYIKVKTKDYNTICIEKGATVLDFAFQLKPQLGLHFSYALINQEGICYGPDTTLRDNDRVVIMTKKNVIAKKEWFYYLKTDEAKAVFLKYIKLH